MLKAQAVQTRPNLAAPPRGGNDSETSGPSNRVFSLKYHPLTRHVHGSVRPRTRKTGQKATEHLRRL